LLESLDFFADPDVPDVVASVFCAFAAAAMVAAAAAPAFAPALVSGCGALACGAAPFAGVEEFGAFGSTFAVAATVAFGAREAGVEGVPLFAVEPGDVLPDVAPFDCCAPFAFVAEEFVPFGVAVGCCCPVGEAVLEPALLLPPFALLSLWLPLPAELFAGVCCGAGGGLAGAGGTLTGADMPASSNAANGWESMFWLCADACAGDGEISEAAAEALDILGTLGTLELREATLVVVCLQPAGQGDDFSKINIFQ
jgi:hypothetical protein